MTPEQVRAHQERIGRAMAKEDPVGKAMVDMQTKVAEHLEELGVTTVTPQMVGRRKMGNQPVEVDGIKFDSRREAARYGSLKLIERSGLIADLRCHVMYSLDVNGVHICDYEADFVYRDLTTGKTVIEDVKFTARANDRDKKKMKRSAVYRLYALKKALMLAIFGLTVLEV